MQAGIARDSNVTCLTHVDLVYARLPIQQVPRLRVSSAGTGRGLATHQDHMELAIRSRYIHSIIEGLLKL